MPTLEPHLACHEEEQGQAHESESHDDMFCLWTARQGGCVLLEHQALRYSGTQAVNRATYGARPSLWLASFGI